MTDKQILLSTSSHWLILLYTTYYKKSGQSGLEKSQKRDDVLIVVSYIMYNHNCPNTIYKLYIDTLGVPGIRIYRLNWSKQTKHVLKSMW